MSPEPIRKNVSSKSPTFRGFAAPTSNTTYTPNQFFDVCLPYCSRGVVRLVGYMLRKTLGWCDENGNPQNEVISFSYADLEKQAGVSHSMIRQALDEATRQFFISCIDRGRPSSSSNSGNVGAYGLWWDESPIYTKSPERFPGFFAGEGNRTYIPNQFFDCLLPRESLAMIRVVGAVIRFSIGFANKYGHRRRQVALSYLDIQRYTKIASPRILSKTIREAIAKNYIERVEEGYFDPNGGMRSRAAMYAVKWADPGPNSLTAPKSEAEKNLTEKFSGTALKSEAADYSEKVSGIQIKQGNKTNKQSKKPSALTGEAAATFERLKEAGFDAVAAKSLALRYPFDRVERQINWIDGRNAKRNRLGMLRKAIEGDWAKPSGEKLGQPNSAGPRGESFTEAVGQIERRLRDRSSKQT